MYKYNIYNIYTIILYIYIYYVWIYEQHKIQNIQPTTCIICTT